MSIAVSLDQLREEIGRRGDTAFAVTVGDDGPHVVSLRLSWDGDVLVGGAGTRTATNVEARPAVTLLWPSAAFADFSLLVDGTATVVDGRLHVTPERAVLHRSAEAAGDGPSCVKVLEAPKG
ncbi:MAG TPA: pyridoxamine 5'-phosphate oxidase family protein [Acidimicrobiales bacterium]|nr:pyridoxamine 5'-phosphate oxidase family protein [Acidimicrobiales bacterium]